VLSILGGVCRQCGAIDAAPFLVDLKRHPSGAEERQLQMQLVDPAHQSQIVGSDRLFPGEDFKMPFAAYDSNGVRLLCGALADSLEYVRKATGRELSEAEVSDIRKTLVHRLTMAHDSGERDPGALKRSALREVFASHAVH
jgi:hypothetical protein